MLLSRFEIGWHGWNEGGGRVYRPATGTTLTPQHGRYKLSRQLFPYAMKPHAAVLLNQSWRTVLRISLGGVARAVAVAATERFRRRQSHSGQLFLKPRARFSQVSILRLIARRSRAVAASMCFSALALPTHCVERTFAIFVRSEMRSVEPNKVIGGSCLGGHAFVCRYH